MAPNGCVDRPGRLQPDERGSGQASPDPHPAAESARELSYSCRTFAHVFEGGGFGVGLTVNQLDVPPRASKDPAAGEKWPPARLGELMPVAARCDAGLAEEMRRGEKAHNPAWGDPGELLCPPGAPRP